MKEPTKTRRGPDMLAEYDFSQGERGKYAARIAEGTNVAVVAPDLALYFPDSESVNDALRTLVRHAKKYVKKTNTT